MSPPLIQRVVLNTANPLPQSISSSFDIAAVTVDNPSGHFISVDDQLVPPFTLQYVVLCAPPRTSVPIGIVVPSFTQASALDAQIVFTMLSTPNAPSVGQQLFPAAANQTTVHITALAARNVPLDNTFFLTTGLPGGQIFLDWWAFTYDPTGVGVGQTPTMVVWANLNLGVVGGHQVIYVGAISPETPLFWQSLNHILFDVSKLVTLSLICSGTSVGTPQMQASIGIAAA